MRGRKHIPGPLRKRGRPKAEPRPPNALPRCPSHLDATARKEWRRLAKPLHAMGLLSTADRGAFAAYCQAWSRWVEAERKLKETPMLIRTPSGYAQQSPWLSIANKQMELMGRYMTELGLTPSARTRLAVDAGAGSGSDRVMRIEFVSPEIGPDGKAIDKVYDMHGNRLEHPPADDPELVVQIDKRV